MKSTGWYPQLNPSTGKSRSVSQGGGVLLIETVRATGLDHGLREALAPWFKPGAKHDPGKIMLDLALAVALGGDCLADLGVLRGEPGVYGFVASDPVVSRLITRLGDVAAKAEKRIQAAISTARAQAWGLAGDQAPHAHASLRDPLVVDLDATLVTSHSGKEQAAPTFKKTFGHHPLAGFADHGPGGTGEPLHIMLRAGNAGSNTAADHILVARTALSRLPVKVSKKILVRADGGGATHDFTKWLTRRVQYSIGFTLPDNTAELYHKIPEDCWTPALNADGTIHDHADVAEFTGLLELKEWPKGMRVIVRREHPHPGAQLRFDDVDGYRLTAFATNTRVGQHQQLELRHRRRARCEDRIRCAKDTGLENLPLQGFGQNRIWLLIVQLACCLIAWAQMLALADSPARVWEPKRLRLRLFSCPAETIRSARRRIIRYNQTHPWAHLLRDAIIRLHRLKT